jgi:hypothetical protein
MRAHAGLASAYAGVVALAAIFIVCGFALLTTSQATPACKAPARPAVTP